jgi:hypothetical protein
MLWLLLNDESETTKWGGGLSQFEVVSLNFLGVTGKNGKRNLNQDIRTPDLNPSRYIALITVIQLWVCHSVQTQGESKHNPPFCFM